MQFPLRAKKSHEFAVWVEAVLEWHSMKRGNRWSGRGDYSKMLSLKEQIEKLRTYREPAWSGNGYQDWTRQWSEECLRILKPGGYLLAFGGTRTHHRLTCGIEDAGFEIRDMIAWVYGSGFPKSLNIGKAVDKIQGNEREEIGKGSCGYQVSISKKRVEEGYRPNLTNATIETTITKGSSDWEGWGSALKPALEPITVARKPIEGTVAENCLKWGVGGINIDGCRVGNEVLPEQKAGQSTIGTFERENMITPERTGRFPANLIHDGSDEVTNLLNDSARFFYCAKDHIS